MRGCESILMLTHQLAKARCRQEDAVSLCGTSETGTFAMYALLPSCLLNSVCDM